MPHIFTLVTPAGTIELDHCWGGQGTLYFEWARWTIRDISRQEVDGAWDGTVRVHDPVPTTTMPVALTLVILMWGSERERDARHQIEEEMRKRLVDVGFRLPVSVQVLNVPSAGEMIDNFDFGNQPPTNA